MNQGSTGGLPVGPGITLQQMVQHQRAAGMPAAGANPAGAPRPGGAHAPRPAAGAPPTGAAAGALKAEAAAAAVQRTKKRKLPDRAIADKVALIIPESTIFNRLLFYDKKISDAIARRKSELKESLCLPEHTRKRLRLYIFNTHAHQPAAAQPSAPTPVEGPSWTLHITGRLIDPPPPSAAAGAAAVDLRNEMQQPGTSGAMPSSSGGKASQIPLTSIIKRLEIKLDPLYSGSLGRVVWDKSAHQGDARNAFELRRRGRVETTASISIELDNQPPRLKLDPRLSGVLGLQYETRARILQALYNYIKGRKLVDAADPTLVNLDIELQTAFAEPGQTVQQVKLSSLSDRLGKLLSPMDPFTISYTIKLDGKSPSPPMVLDLDYDLPVLKSFEKIAPQVDKNSKDKEIEGVDSRLAAAIRQLNEHRRRRAFYLGFSQSPVDFINALIASQARDLRIARTTASGVKEFEVSRRSEPFRDKWVQEAVVKYLQKKISSGH